MSTPALTQYDGPHNRWELQQINLQQTNPGAMTDAVAAANTPFASVFNQQQHIAYRDDQEVIWDAWYDLPNNLWTKQKINLRLINNDLAPAAWPPPGGAGDDSWYD